MKLSTRLAFLAAITAVACSLSACSTNTADEEASAGSSNELVGGGAAKSVTMVYLGSSSFLRQCAGTTLGCGKKVSSVSDSTPYFSAPNGWGAACNAWYTIRANGRCVEAQRFEVSDRNAKIEGNPAVFEALGSTYSDGRNCSGSGKVRVTMTAGRHCGTSGALEGEASGELSADADAADGDFGDGDGSSYGDDFGD